MPDTSDTPILPLAIALEENLRCHAIGAEIFAPFVLERFGAGSSTTFAELSIIIDFIGNNFLHLKRQIRSKRF